MCLAWLEQCEADVPSGGAWLSAAEAERLSGLKFSGRRADWRLGRWTAKRALAAFLKLPCDPDGLARIEIRPAADGAPEAFVSGDPAPAVISLSHRGGVGACAVGLPGSVLGCDLEIVEPRSDAFAADYFTAAEQVIVASAGLADRFFMLALLWSAKESVLKAVRTGLRVDTRSVEIEPVADSRLRARYEGAAFNVRWRRSGNLVRTLCWQGEHWPFEP